MYLYTVLFFVPALVAMAIAKLYFHWKYSWKEFAVQVIGTFVVLLSLFALGDISQTKDTKILNGTVTELKPRQETCPAGWRDWQDDFCTEYRTRQVYSHTTCSGTGSSRTCTRHYDTEYNYIYPWERRYFVKTDIPNSYEISRVDRQGANIPPRFAEINIGDPVAVSESYTNYIRGASSSLFSEEDPVDPVPIAYPKIFDYYKANRVIVYGYETNNQFHKNWNESLAQVNGNIRKTGANVIVALTALGPEFAEAIARQWEAHNINDVVVAIGTTDKSSKQIAWVDVRSWSDTSLVNIEIENEISNLGTLDTRAIDAIIQQAVLENFKLRSMEDFEYLADDIAPPTWAIVLAAIVLLIGTPLVTYMFHKHDVF